MIRLFAANLHFLSRRENFFMEHIFHTTEFTVNQLIEKIESGELGLPEIQRPFVWSNTKVRDLLDSMFMGYPVGYLMLWENPKTEKVKSIGTDSKSYDSPKEVIIDGQQRLTALYAVMKDKEVLDSNYKKRAIIISFHPLTGKFEVGTPAIKNNHEWIYNLSELFTSSTSSKFIKTFKKNLEAHNIILTDEEEDMIDVNIERVFNLNKLYKFPVFMIEDSADEEAISQVFVRINSAGTPLQQNDFILTLMSVHWDEGRRSIEEFCRASRMPSTGEATAFNSLGIEISAQDIIRTVMGYAFNRARLLYAYKLLRGVDLEKKGVVSKDLRDKNFDTLKAKLPDVMDVTNWHEFLKAIMNAGYRSDKMILSGNAIFFTYAMYLTAKYKFNAPDKTNKALASLWFFYAQMTSLYTGSFESVAESHFTALKGFTTFNEYKQFIAARVNEALTDDYFDITLPGSGQGGLAVSGSGNNAWFAYVAALNILDRKVLFSTSNLKVRDLMNLGIDGKKKSLEKHHLFPKAYLKGLNYPDTKINQMANYAFIDWNDNIAILDEAPSIYYPEICKGRTQKEINTMEEENALPHGWENMSYEDFLEARRKLMAKIIKQGFETLKSNI